MKNNTHATKKEVSSYNQNMEKMPWLEYVLFKYYMNKLWIFEVLIIAFPKMWVGGTKTVIQHDLQQLYIFATIRFFPLHAYFLPTHKNGDIQVLRKLRYIPCIHYLLDDIYWMTIQTRFPSMCNEALEHILHTSNTNKNMYLNTNIEDMYIV
jgi:hypothetical protein